MWSIRTSQAHPLLHTSDAESMFLYKKCYGGVKKTIAFVGRELLPSPIHRRRKGEEIKQAKKSLK